jgi:hypothetical protein
MGMAVYGARVGDEVCWMSPAGPEVATITELFYQPEAAGHHSRSPRAASAYAQIAALGGDTITQPGWNDHRCF